MSWNRHTEQGICQFLRATVGRTARARATRAVALLLGCSKGGLPMFSARRTALASVLGLGLVIGVAAGATPGSRNSVDASASMNKQSFHDAMRTLWAGDHIVWTRCFIISAGTLPEVLPDTQATTDRLLANQTAIGNAIKTFYGDQAGNDLTALLRTHILTAADLVFAAKAGDSAAVE